MSHQEKIVLGQKRDRCLSPQASKPNSSLPSDQTIQKDFMEVNLHLDKKSNCEICKRDLKSTIKFFTNSKLEFCINCFVSSKIDNSYKLDFVIGDKLNFALFTDEWSAAEEILLLTGIEKYGLDNWQDISEFMGSKSKLQCESHYYTFYYTSESNLPNSNEVIVKNVNEIQTRQKNKLKEEKVMEEVKRTQGNIPEFNSNKDPKNNVQRSIVKNRNKKDQNNFKSAAEIVGYWPKREEFENEYLNDAELEIADLEFLDDDTSSDYDLKINVLQVYNKQLQSRDTIKKFVIERNLLDIKNTMNYERKLPKDDREIYNSLKPLARLMSHETFLRLFEGIVLEKNLRQRINQLKQYKNSGYNTYDEIEKLIEGESKIKKEEKKLQNEGNGLTARLNKFFKSCRERQKNSNQNSTSEKDSEKNPKELKKLRNEENKQTNTNI